MPPKKTNQQSDKSKQKDKQKIVEDKTFGLKNKKKSAKVQQQIKQIQNQVMQPGNNKALVPFGVDPKTVLCQFFKAGQCQKGDKCKFSHDMAVERKSTKIDLYTDARADEAKKNDTIDKWDQKKLEEVVTSKHGNPKTTTDIVCKYFLEAIENQKYGWFWECPNGGKACKYKHALPPGFVLKSKKVKEEEIDEITLEEFLETESFTEWKKNRKAKQDADKELKLAAKEAAFKAGKSQGMSGHDEVDDNDSDNTEEHEGEQLVYGQEAVDENENRSDNPYGEGGSKDNDDDE
ncbi:5354_t:CDS:2 [Entrophospora sp. SA101]|nr:8206_t:CDS:2 [Entrophospora sp. SA101]CAJ0767934.1 5350_t:CDS:2 [Entrophospora sp. SA101]CAJ0767938.1 5354_t:CDS:2 [Entrophospora sp. SA101]CAJ0824014.1 19300_t:CDS:2 [Entrophospora sp. SA101]CAJ0824021.1 19304_t:CDS:2 [Entrophospora sp. SA101]